MNKLILTTLWAILLSVPASIQASTIDFKFDDSVAFSMVRGEIQAPIETTRFQIGGALGDLKVDLDDMKKTHGTIKIDLAAIQSYSFADQGKNAKQTEHMINWFETGSDVPEKVRNDNRWAIFKIKKVIKSVPSSVQEAKPFTDEIGTGYNFAITVEGDLKIHGVTSKHTVQMNISIWEVKADGDRYKTAKRVLLLRTVKPIEVSMKHHDVKPRDITGKFLAKALSVVGLKIADTVLISLDLRAYEAK